MINTFAGSVPNLGLHLILHSNRALIMLKIAPEIFNAQAEFELNQFIGTDIALILVDEVTKISSLLHTIAIRNTL